MAQRALSRRRFLQTAGVATVVVAGGLVWRAADQGVFSAGQGPAYEPWQNWQREMDAGPLALVRAGILGANPHNSQAWLFQVSDDAVDLFADTGRHLGAMDPYLREMHLGLGCALENMMLAAAAEGYEVDLSLAEGSLSTYMADSGMKMAATLALVNGESQQSSLYEAIPNRHTNRFAYTGELLPASIVAEMEAFGDEAELKVFLFPAGTPAFAQFQAGTAAGAQFIVDDEQMAHDSFAWFPTSWDEVQREKAGPYIDTAGVSESVRVLVKMAPGMPSQDTVDSAIVNAATHDFESAALAGIIAVRSLYDINQTLRAGRLWQRLHLWATTQGVAMQPHNEMPEVVDRERQLGLAPQMAEHLAAITGDDSWLPTFTFRAGWPTVSPLPSARRPVEEVVVT